MKIKLTAFFSLTLLPAIHKKVLTCKGLDAVVSLLAGDDMFLYKNAKFWYGRGKILVKKNYTPGVKKKSKKNQKLFFSFFFSFSDFFLKSPEFWYGRGKILVKKNYSPGVKKNLKKSKNFKKISFSNFF